jgi:hypothetical protein
MPSHPIIPSPEIEPISRGFKVADPFFWYSLDLSCARRNRITQRKVNGRPQTRFDVTSSEGMNNCIRRCNETSELILTPWFKFRDFSGNPNGNIHWIVELIFGLF